MHILYDVQYIWNINNAIVYGIQCHAVTYKMNIVHELIDY